MPFCIRESNLANAKIDEYNKDGTLGVARFGLRLEYICKTLANMHSCKPCDVCCLSELRSCHDADGVSQLHPTEIVHRIATATGYGVAIAAPNNLTELPFWKATLYNKETMVHLASGFTNIEVPLPNQINFLWSKFKGNDTILWVINIHYLITEQVATARWFTDNIEKVLVRAGANLETDTVVFIGDCNTFMDVNGAEQLAILREKFVIPEHGEYTFRSFPHNDWQGTSILDHGGVLRNSSTPKAEFITYPIDHRYSDHAVVELQV